MSKATAITTGEQSVTATGAVTGTLDTSALTGNYDLHVRCRGLLAGQSIMVSLEDTAGSTPFSDALPIAVFHFAGAQPQEGVTLSRRWYEISAALFGATNNKFRVNALRVTGSPTALIDAWIEQ